MTATRAIPSHLTAALEAPVAIFGAGVSGEGVQELLGVLGARFRTYDAAGIPFTIGAAAEHRLAIYSPGFAPHHSWIGLARLAGIDCWNELDFASAFWRGRVIAVTGTNGKTTLTEFLVHALRSVGQAAVAAGNNGRAFTAVAAQAESAGEGQIVVCEVSSFQAETLRHLRPEATLWTNFAEDHLERHGTMKNYFAAKAVLAARSLRWYGGSSVQAAQEWGAFGRLPAGVLDRAVWVAFKGLAPDDPLVGTVFAEPPQRENFALAQSWWKASGLPEASLYAAARSFRLGPHRLARVGVLGGAVFWNDSKATNFHAVEAALTRFDDPVLLIAGGKSKGGDLPGFVRRIAPKVREFFLIGDTAPAMAAAARAAGVPCRIARSLRECTAAAAQAARPGDQILLSPGFASFDMFRGYHDRGEQFEAIVRDLNLSFQS